MIQLENVSKVYGATRAVEKLNLFVAAGETLALLGTSGCGKTTTLRMINRLVEPTEGKILVNGQNILQQQPEQLRKSIGYVLQHHGLFPHYTIAENIGMVPALLKWDKKDIATRITELMLKLQLPESLANLFPGQLSGGQQQRVGLARALAAKPPVLLMDEPLGALDPVTRSTIRKEFKKLDELKSKTVIIVTHDVQEAFELADKICLMDKGKIVQAGTPSELLFRPVNEFVSSFLADQRLQLELENIFVKEIAGSLAIANEENNQIILSEELSLWEVLETISLKSDKEYVMAVGESLRLVTVPLVMSGYEVVKNANR